MKFLPPPVLFMLCLVAGVIGERYEPLPILGYDFRRSMSIGVLFWLAAFLLGALAFREMRRHHTPIEPGQQPRHLVTSGPFRFTRNPLYLSLLLMLLGFAAALNSYWLVFGALFLFALLSTLVVRREEEMIARLYGQAYEEYRRRVRRWL